MSDELADSLLAGLSLCRTCEHTRLVHKNGVKKCTDGALSSTAEWIRCTCSLFIPSDNLEYIAWVYKNKEEK